MTRGPSNDPSVLFGTPALIDVTRGLAEFRAGRPIEVTARTSVLALPVEALTSERLSAFQGFCAPVPRLVVTCRRAMSIGIVTPTPVALQLAPGMDADAVHQAATSPVLSKSFTVAAAG